jgi:hypothetical protein
VRGDGYHFLFARAARALLFENSLEFRGIGIYDSEDRRIFSDLSQISTTLAELVDFTRTPHWRPDPRTNQSKASTSLSYRRLVSLRLFLLRLSVSCCCALRAPSFRCSRRGLCAWLLWRMGELKSRSQGRHSKPLFPLRLAFFCAWACCVVSWSEEVSGPPFSAALGLAAALGLTFFGVRASWTAVVVGNPRTFLLRCAWPCRSTWLYSARGRAVLCRSRGSPPNLPSPLRCSLLGLLRRACELNCRSRRKPPNLPSLLRLAWPLRSAWPSSACERVGLP